MLQIFCNLVIPGLGTLFMQKPIIGVLQILLFMAALVLAVTVFLTFYGIVFWFVDLIWALATGIFWYRGRQAKPLNS